MARNPTESKLRPRVLRQLQESPKGLDLSPGAVLPRLHLRYADAFALRPERLAERIRSLQNIAYFCDSNQFIAPTDPCIWDALLSGQRLVLIPPLIDELQWWLDDPQHNLTVHKLVKAKLDGDDIAPISVFTMLDHRDLIPACEYYVNLLGMRKKLFDMIRRMLEHELGRSPTNQEVSNRSQSMGTARAQLLGRQGEHVRIPAHKYNDECLVVMAFFYALITGQHVAIISGDEAVFDQFHKANWLIGTHYLSMLMAERYANDPRGFDSQWAENIYGDAFTDDRVTLLRKPADVLGDLLPAEHTSVAVSCLLVRNEVAEMTFRAEMEMRRVLEIKARTSGLSTDRLDGRNCHLVMGACAPTDDWAVVANDRAIRLPDGKTRLAMVDVNLALSSGETT